MALDFPNLPYELDALEPYISRATLEVHHGRHHRAYVTKTNELIAGTEFARAPLESIVKGAAGRHAERVLFNNAAQAWNHAFLWNSMRPNGAGIPMGPIAREIDRQFKSFDAFERLFKATALTQFGSGWAWLVLDHGKLNVETTSNADTPLAHGKVPLLTADLWEHAYYLDYQNRREEYLTNFLTKLANWDFANANLERAKRERRAAE